MPGVPSAEVAVELVPTVSRARSTSLADWVRSAGSFCSSCSIRAASGAGQSERRVRTGTATSLR